MKITKRPPTLMNRFNNRNQLFHDGHHLTGILYGIFLLQMSVPHHPRRQRHTGDVIHLQIAVFPRSEHPSKLLHTIYTNKIPQHLLLN